MQGMWQIANGGIQIGQREMDLCKTQIFEGNFMAIDSPPQCLRQFQVLKFIQFNIDIRHFSS